jgi:transposase-like protein
MTVDGPYFSTCKVSVDDTKSDAFWPRVKYEMLSLRNTAKSLKLLAVVVSHQTVYNWIEKYTALMPKYLDKITPQVSDT